ncbi:MAG: molybdopterin molybdotransferase MoeA [Acetobacteraceae bacterium]|nr:molybdopterin molybdotransferase MoeA [Acetobacteraceae bacterium]
MISVEDARARILAGLEPTGGEVVGLAEAAGRVLAEDIRARLTHPPHDVSAMDGYAIRAADPQPRRVIGAAPAGHPFAGEVGPGEAVRLFTGSVVPAGADTVVLQEDTDRSGDEITIRETIRPGQHIRRAGQDFRAGDVMVPARSWLNPRRIGLIAAANHAWVPVHRRPVVAILATGDEIVLPGEPVGHGGIVSSNAHALAALVRACGGEAMVLPIAGDSIDAIAAAAHSARHADILVTTGGASVGDHDLVAPALATLGMQLDFWKIAMRPGKPLMHGMVGAVPLIGLPGNPVSSYLCAVLFLKPAIERLLGLPGAAPQSVPARLVSDLAANDKRADHLRCRLHVEPDGSLRAEPFSKQDSGMLSALARADGVIQRAPYAPAATAGDVVPVLRFDALGG